MSTLALTDIFIIVVPIVSLGATVWITMRFNRVEEIRYTYGVYDKLTDLRIQNPEFSFLLYIPPIAQIPLDCDYDKKYLQIKKACAAVMQYKLDTGQVTMEDIQLKERAIATIIFSEFSHICRRYDGTFILDRNLNDFLEGAFQYFVKEVLRNPRLLYFWNDDREKLGKYYYGLAEAVYDKKVVDKGDEEKEDESEDTKIVAIRTKKFASIGTGEPLNNSYIKYAKMTDRTGPFKFLSDTSATDPMTDSNPGNPYGTKWDSEPRSELTAEDKEKIWAKQYEDAQGDFISVVNDDRFVDKVWSELNQITSPPPLLSLKTLKL